MAFGAADSWGQEPKTPISAPSKEAAKAPEVQRAKSVEDWTTLDVKKSGLVMKRPELADKGEFPNLGFVRERYEVEWRDTDPFDLYVIRPTGVQKPAVILYLYSYPDDTESFKRDTWCETAVTGGYAAVGFVGAVTGHRTRFRAHKDWFVSEMQEALGSSVHDVQLILDYLTQRGDLDMSRVAMFGSGSGGAIAVLASAADPRIKVVDLLAPWGGWPTWLAETKVIPDDERANYLKPEFMAKVAPLDPVDWFPKIKAKRVRILDIRSNKAMPNKSQEMLEAAAPDVAIINQYGNGRAFFGAQPGMTLFDWMKEQLKTDSKPQIAQEKSERIHFYPAVEAPPEQKLLNSGQPAKPEKPQPTEQQKPQ
jgi:hypothetical protein